MKVIGTGIFILQSCLLSQVLCQGKPKIPKVGGSYRTMGEIIYKLPDSSNNLQMYIEENYDKISGKSSLFYSIEGINATIFEDLNQNQVWLLTYEDDKPVCVELNSTDFENPELPWRIYQLTGEREVLPIRQLFNLQDKNLTKWGQKYEYRKIPALNYQYDLTIKENGIPVRYEIQSAWSDGTQMSPSVFNTVPLGFKITKIVHVPEVIPITTVRNINLFAFIHNDINQRMFLPIKGISCPGIKNREPFPVLDDFKSISFNAEFIINRNSSTKNYIDFWMDLDRKLVQIDQYVLEDKSQSSPTTIRGIFTAEQGAFYAYPLDDTTKTKSETNVGDLKSQKFQPEYIIDHRDPLSYNLKGFFGIDKYQYVKTGTATERGIPCSIYQTTRDDWPPISSNKITTVWEWCFADGQNIFYPSNALPLVSLNIRVVKLKTKPEVDWLFEGSQLSLQFYNVRKPDLVYLDTTVFDITPCFSDNHQNLLQFQVKLSPDIEKVVTKETSNFYFNSAWKSAIATAIVSKPSSLRVASVRTMVPEVQKPMLVTLTLLDRHPKLPRDIRVKEEGLEGLKQRLQKAIDKGKVQIVWKLNQKNIKLEATPGTLALRAISKPRINPSSNYSQVLDLIEKSRFLASSAIYFKQYQHQEPEKPRPSSIKVTGNDLTTYLGIALFIGLLSGILTTYFIRAKYQRL